MTNDTPDTTPDTGGSEGWTTTEVAGAALGRNPRTIKRLITSGELLGRQVKRGRARPYEVDVASLKALRDRWLAEGKLRASEVPEDAEIPEGGYEEADRVEGVARAFERVARDLADASARAASAETRLQLTERAESTVREELAATRRENERLREELRAERSRKGRGLLRRLLG